MAGGAHDFGDVPPALMLRAKVGRLVLMVATGLRARVEKSSAHVLVKALSLHDRWKLLA
jgi:hypothetical protein